MAESAMALSAYVSLGLSLVVVALALGACLVKSITTSLDLLFLLVISVAALTALNGAYAFSAVLTLIWSPFHCFYLRPLIGQFSEHVSSSKEKNSFYDSFTALICVLTFGFVAFLAWTGEPTGRDQGHSLRNEGLADNFMGLFETASSSIPVLLVAVALFVSVSAVLSIVVIKLSHKRQEEGV